MTIQRQSSATPSLTATGDAEPSNERAIRVLRSFLEEDEAEQRETWEYLKQALDEDRANDEKLFP